MGGVVPLPIKNKTVEVETLYNEGIEMTKKDAFQAKCIGEKIEQESISNNYPLGLVKGWYLLGVSWDLIGDYSRAFNFLEKALELAKEIADMTMISLCLRSIGNIHYKLGDLERALQYFLEGLEISQSQHPISDAAFLNNISVVYSKMGQLENSLKFLLESLELIRNEGGSTFGFYLANVSEVYSKLGNAEKAMQYAEHSEEVLKEHPEHVYYNIQCLKAKAKALLLQAKHEEAISVLTEGISLTDQVGDLYRKTTLMTDLGKIYLSMKEWQTAELSLQDAYSLAVQINAEVEQKEISYARFQIAEEVGDFQAALNHYKVYVSLKEKIASKDLEITLLNKTISFNAEQARKDEEIQRLKHEEIKRLAEQEVLRSSMLADALREVQVIGELAQQLTATLDFNDIFKILYRKMKQTIELDSFGICFYDAEREEIEFKMTMCNGKCKTLNKVSIHEPNSYAAICIREKKIVVQQHLEGLMMKSLIFIPLIIEGQVIGAMTIQSQRENAFSHRNQRMFMAIGPYIAIALNNARQSDALKRKTMELEVLSHTDPLTGLHNRRSMNLQLEEAYQLATGSEGGGFAVVLIDADHFKLINDTYGHDAGDAVLVKLAKTLGKFLGQEDSVGRWGGEEFIFIFKGSDYKRIQNKVIEICTKIEETRFSFKNQSINVTVTAGIVFYENQQTREELLRQADLALYQGKNAGRNQVVVYKKEIDHIMDV